MTVYKKILASDDINKEDATKLALAEIDSLSPCLSDPPGGSVNWRRVINKVKQR